MTFGTGGETIFPDSLNCSVLSAVPQGWCAEKAGHHWRGQQGLQRSGWQSPSTFLKDGHTDMVRSVPAPRTAEIKDRRSGNTEKPAQRSAQAAHSLSQRHCLVFVALMKTRGSLREKPHAPSPLYRIKGPGRPAHQRKDLLTLPALRDFLSVLVIKSHFAEIMLCLSDKLLKAPR